MEIFGLVHLNELLSHIFTNVFSPIQCLFSFTNYVDKDAHPILKFLGGGEIHESSQESDNV